MKRLKSAIWAIIVAFMIGIHNFYKGENKFPDDIVNSIEHFDNQENGAPKD